VSAAETTKNSHSKMTHRRLVGEQQELRTTALVARRRLEHIRMEIMKRVRLGGIEAN